MPLFARPDEAEYEGLPLAECARTCPLDTLHVVVRLSHRFSQLHKGLLFVDVRRLHVLIERELLVAYQHLYTKTRAGHSRLQNGDTTTTSHGMDNVFDLPTTCDVHHSFL